MAKDSSHAEVILRSATDELLRESNPGQLREAAQQLYALFSEISNLSMEDPRFTESTILPGGKAISPNEAANCLLDFGRTAKFLGGVQAALIEAQRRFSNERLEVVYAGCGPFAPLLLPLLGLFDPQRLSITLIDIHKRSLESAQAIVNTLGLAQHISSYVQADAANYLHHTPIHVLIIECMQSALEKEPQVAVTLNLAQQLHPEGTLVPEEISVELTCMDESKEFALGQTEADVVAALATTKRLRRGLGCVLHLSANSAATRNAEDVFTAVIDVPEIEDGLRLVLLTKVRVFGSIVLGDYESAITCPHPLEWLDETKHSGGLEFTYATGTRPGFRYRWID